MQRVSIGYQGKPLRRNLRCWFNSDRRIVQGDLREDGSCCEDLDGGSLKKFSSRQTKLRISKASSRFPTERPSFWKRRLFYVTLFQYGTS